METKKVPPIYGVLLYWSKVIFEDLIFLIGYFTLKIITLWKFPKSLEVAQKIDIVIFLVAFIVIIGFYFMVFIA
jgi:hypothetical protein